MGEFKKKMGDTPKPPAGDFSCISFRQSSKASVFVFMFMSVFVNMRVTVHEFLVPVRVLMN